MAPSEPSQERERVGRVYVRYGTDPRKRESWSAENPGNRAIRSELVDAVWSVAGLELQAAAEILDVGCGTGWWLEELAATDAVTGSLHGVELLEQRVSAASERVPAATIVAGDARRLPYCDERFGFVSLFTVLSSLPDRGAVSGALREAARVLAPGGALVVWEPRIPNPLNPDTLFVPASLVRGAVAEAELETRSTTLLPPLARRFGRWTERLYPGVASVGILRSHRLICLRIAR